MRTTKQTAPSPAEIRNAFIAMATEFVRVSGMSKSAVGLAALKDSNFLFRVEDGEDFTLKSYRRVFDFMIDNWPKDTVPASKRKGKAA